MSALVPTTVKVDNWGIYVLQRFKHFFNRTDYCDLTLQFQDNAQLKVHRLVLSACTEYFELLERTCEMYEDCLVMPDDLQADVVVPIVNFMYTGQLEFRMEILERLHACSEIMNMPVLSKLLDSHRHKAKTTQSYSKKASKPQTVQAQQPKYTPSVAVEGSAVVTSNKRTHTKAFEKTTVVLRDKKHQIAVNKESPAMKITNGGIVYRPPSPIPLDCLGKYKAQKTSVVPSDPRPTRYELPEELDSDNLFENSFSNISYTSQPLMVHPETTKQYTKRSKLDKGSMSKKSRTNTLDIVECKKITKQHGDGLFEETDSSMISDDVEIFRAFDHVDVKTEPEKDPNKLFDQLLDQEEQSPKVTIETPKSNKAGANLDHAKIISEVLKKYPHLVKSNKNIKLKIFNNPTPTKAAGKKQKPSPQSIVNNAENMKIESVSNYTYETDVIDSKQAAKLIALGADNIEGPWICLICGTPGKALHFTSYYKFRRHLVEVHNEKPVPTLCEFCGQRMIKRNHMLYHLYSKHGVEPPPSHRFPKCPQCSYIALNEAILVKHKLSHSQNENFRCNVCPSAFNSSKMLLNHIQNTGHKYIADRKSSHQCIYCLRMFVRENNLYAHLKTHHKADALKDGIIDESDDEVKDTIEIKYEPVHNEYEENMEYHIQQNPNGNIQLIPKKPSEKTPLKQTILNTGFTPNTPKPATKSKATKASHNVPPQNVENSFDHENEEEIVLIDNNEYIMSGDRLILKHATSQSSEEFILSDKAVSITPQSITPSTSINYATMISTNDNIQQGSILIKDTENLSEPIPIYVSNDEEYKALMASNHNIVFDSTDENKTLTVLTTTESGTLNNTDIDLDNAQNTDMMIIPDNYPLTVSEAVATDSSKIVVVYSQQVGDSNKGYQLLTTQALGQYAPTSGILTNNYETISTACPVTSAQILDSPVTTWQGEILQNINNETTNSSAVLQSIVQPEEIQVSDAQESNSNNSDLPEVQLKADTNQPAVISPIEGTNNDEPSEKKPETQVIQCAQIIPMEVDDAVIATIGNEVENVASVVSNSENVIIVPISVEQETEKIKEMETYPAGQEYEKIKEIETPVIEQIPESETVSEVETEIIRMDVPNTDSNENTVNNDIPHSDIIEIKSMDEININEVNETIHEPIEEAVTETNAVITIKAVQEIQTLASEWSDDAMSQDAIDNASVQEQTNPEIEAEVEESIENIQEELLKQTSDSISLDEDDATTPNDELPSQETRESENIETVDPKVKLSSLLNDWDDNDSQEDNGIDKNVSVPTELTIEIPETPDGNTIDQEAANDETLDSAESQDNSSTIPDEDENMENTQANPQAIATKPDADPVIKQDKIKSLVSDWDDDEEEEKE